MGNTYGSQQKISTAQLHAQQFQNYQVKKMYDNAEVGDFGNPETKLKQMQMKLSE